MINLRDFNPSIHFGRTSGANKAAPEKTPDANVGAQSKNWSSKFTQFNPQSLSQSFKANPRTQQAFAHAKAKLTELKTSLMTKLAGLSEQLNKPNSGKHGASFPPNSPPFYSGNPTSPAQHVSDEARPAQANAGRQAEWEFDADTNVSRTTWTDTAGKSWTAASDHNTGGYTSATQWSARGNDGTHTREVIDHQSGIRGVETYNPATGRHMFAKPFSAPDAGGFQHREVFDHQSGTLWHESVNTATGVHMSATGWSAPDRLGRQYHAVFNHSTGQLHHEVFPPRTQGVPPKQDETTAKVDEAFSTLGLAPNAAREDVKKTYRKLALKWHPDKSAGKEPAEIKIAEEKFKAISHANDILTEHFEKMPKAADRA